MRDVPSSVIFSSSCFILMLSGTCCIYFFNPLFISPRTSSATWIAVAFLPQILSISISRSIFFDSFSATLTEVFFSISKQLFSCLFLIATSGLLALLLLLLLLWWWWWWCPFLVDSGCSAWFIVLGAGYNKSPRVPGLSSSVTRPSVRPVVHRYMKAAVKFRIPASTRFGGESRGRHSIREKQTTKPSLFFD